MAALDTLRNGCSYSLITEPVNKENRQVYFVKLTDSCLKAIEDFVQEVKHGSKIQSFVCFDESQNGSIKVSGKADCEKKFRFAISNILSSENNPLPECIKQPSVNSDRLLSFGPLEQKISIAATDDCYENTRNRMTQVDQERKDVRTKEIKLAAGRKKGKNVLSKTSVPEKPSAVKNIKKMNNYNTNSPKSAVTSSSTNHIFSANVPKHSPLSSSRKSPSSSSTNKVPSPSLVNGKSFTCRDRVVHVLALRPHKKPELIARLQREAMSQKDRNNLAMVLQQVSSHSDNQYSLLPYLYADLEVDSWPFYTESEKAIVKKNVAANMHAKKPVSSSPPLVSSTTSKSPQEEKSVSKRTSELPPGDTSNAKKPKLEVSEEPSSTSSSPQKTSQRESTTSQREGKQQQQQQQQQQQPSKAAEEESKGEDSPPHVASTSDSPEYLKTYKPITSREQRFQYKRDFQLEYTEYIELKKKIDPIATTFMKLESALKKETKGSQEYLKIQDQIVTAYNEQSEKYLAMKSRYEKLHMKLGHIKRLVMEYDNQMVNS